jgi:hypothetical protein
LAAWFQAKLQRDLSGALFAHAFALYLHEGIQHCGAVRWVILINHID